MAYVLLILGLTLVYLGAEWLVGGASRFALGMGMRQLAVGLTVVAYGTSIPELVVGVDAALDHHPEIALGNVIGSNIANIGLILGFAALARPACVDGNLRRRELPLLLASAAALPLVLADGWIARWEGALLLVGAIGTTWYLLRHAGAPSSAPAQDETTPSTPPAARGRWSALAKAGVGLGVLLAGGHLFVDSATKLAVLWGLGDRVIGLTVVALGTSLPELATSAVAAVRGHSDITVGNVIGSNVFNVLFCLGATALIAPIGSSLSALVVDLAVLLGITVLGAFFMRSARVLSRAEGGLLLASYIGFMIYLGASA